MRDLTTQGKILIFNLLAISKVVYLALIKTAYFYCKTIEYYKKLCGKKKKIKPSTLCNIYENDGLKDIDVFYK